MKRNIILIGFIIALFAACQPIEDRIELKSAVAASDVKFNVTQKAGYDNMVIVENKTPGTIPYWELGTKTSNKLIDTVVYPFAGTYKIKLSVYGQGGATADSTQIQVTKNDPSFFSDPRWAILANGVIGKTWVHDMSDPGIFYGTQWPDKGADNWSWDPGSFQSWFPMTQTEDDGWIKFDLNGGYNYTASRKNVDGTFSPQKGTFSVDFSAKTANPIMTLNGALLAGIPGFYATYSNWGRLYVTQCTADRLVLAVYRDNDPNNGPCWFGIVFKPAPSK